MAKYDLQRFRRERSMTQIQLAKALGVSQGFLSGMETGRNPFPEERRKNFAEAYPDVDLENYVMADIEPVKVKVTELGEAEGEAQGRKTVVEFSTGETRRELIAAREQADHRHSPEFQKYLDAVNVRFSTPTPDFELPSMREKLAELLEENENLNKWNDELRDKSDKLRDQLDTTRDDLFAAQQEVIRLQRLLLKHKIDF